MAFRYALRVWPLLIWAVKNSRTRFAALGVGANSGAGLSFRLGETRISVDGASRASSVIIEYDKGRYHTLK